MGLFLKEEQLLAYVSDIMSSELGRHCNKLKKICLHDMFPQLPVQPSTKYTRTDTLSYDPYWFLIAHAIKHNHKPTSDPPSTVIADAENHSLPPFSYLALVISLYLSITSL